MEDKKDVAFDVVVTQILTAHDTINTKDYEIDDCGLDDSGCREFFYDTSKVDFENEWRQQQYSIEDLLKLLSIYLNNELENTDKEDICKRMSLVKKIEACRKWTLDDTDVRQD